MQELNLLKERKRCLEKALVSNQRMINKYVMEGENLQRKYDEEKLKYDFLSDISEKKEQFEAAYKESQQLPKKERKNSKDSLRK